MHALHNYTSTDVICNGDATGTVTIEPATGGTPDYTYTIDNAAATLTELTFRGLEDGTYTVTATDANGCTATTTVTVSEPAAVAVGTSTVTDASRSICHS